MAGDSVVLGGGGFFSSYTLTVNVAATPNLSSMTISAFGATLAVGTSTLNIAGTSSTAINVTAGRITIAGGQISDAGGLALASGTSLKGSGTVAATLSGHGTITASGGVLDLTGTVGSGLTLAIGTGAASDLKIDGTATAATPIAINNANQTLEIGAAGSLAITASESIARGHIQLDGGTLTDTSGVALASGATLSGQGTVSAPLSGGGTITASGGTLEFMSAVDSSTASAFQIANVAGADLRFDGNVGTASVHPTISFNGANGLLDLSHTSLGGFHGTIANFASGDGIEVAGATGATLDSTGTTLTVSGSSGTLGTIALGSSYTGDTFSVANNIISFVPGSPPPPPPASPPPPPPPPPATGPTTTPASLTVAENAGPTAIGIAAPTDSSYSASQLTVTVNTVNGLPTDGTVYLADGTTAVTAGETLTVAQLTGLTFKPAAGQFSQTSSFTYTVTDPAALSAAGSATTTIGPDTTPPKTTAALLTVLENAGPTAIGITAPTDINYGASQLTVTVNGLPTDGTVYLADGTTAVTAGEALSVAQLTGLTFKPTPGLASQSSTFSYTVTDPSSLSTPGSATLAIGGPSPPTVTVATVINGPTNSNNATLNGFNVIPPDNGLAASASAIVMAENDVIEITSLNGTVIQPAESLSTFFGPVAAGFSFLTDPRVVFDQSSGRFIVTTDALVENRFSGVTGSAVLYAISGTGGPSGWTFGQVNTTYGIGNQTTWGDQPTISSNGTNLYVTTAQFGVQSGNYVANAVTIIPLAGGAVSAFNLGSLADYRPAAVSGGSYYVGYTGDSLQIRFNANGSSSFTSSSISLGAIDIGNGAYSAAQKGSSVLLDAGDGSVASTAISGNTLYAVFEVVPPGGSQPAVHWVEINLANNSLIAQGNITGPNGAAAFNPSIAVDGNGDVLVNYTVSSSTMDPAAYASVMPAGSSAFLSPVLYGSSAAPETADFGVTNNVIRWGDYSSAVADPGAANTFVVSNEIVPSAQTSSNDAPWATVTADITVSPGTGTSSAVIANNTATTGSSTGGSTTTSQLPVLTADTHWEIGRWDVSSTVAALDATNMPNFAPAVGSGFDGGQGNLGLLVNFMASTFVGGGNGPGSTPTVDQTDNNHPPNLTFGHG